MAEYMSASDGTIDVEMVGGNSSITIVGGI